MIAISRNLPLGIEAAPAEDKRPRAWVVRKRQRQILLLVALALLACVSFFALHLGPTRASLSDLADSNSPLHYIAINIRLPRVVAGLVVGASLALAGALLQGLLRNPLADPGVLGVTSSAGLGAALAYLFIPMGLVVAPFFAFVFAVAAAFVVIGLASRQKDSSNGTLILCGIALGTTAAALLSVAMVLAHDDVMPLITWMIGSIGGKSWGQLWLSGGLCIAGSVVAVSMGRRLNVAQLGETAAKGLGLDFRATRIWVILTASLLIAGSASLAGLVGFVGLIVPHLTRKLCGDDYTYLLPLSALLGASLVVGGDLVSRTVIAPTELPVGAITALCGGPFFFYLVLRPTRSKLCPYSH